jgi:hypothetical protein
MIKINLLPTKRKPPKKLTELQQQLVLGVLLLTVTLGAIAFTWIALTVKAARSWEKVNAARQHWKPEKKLAKVASGGGPETGPGKDRHH